LIGFEHLAPEAPAENEPILINCASAVVGKSAGMLEIKLALLFDDGKPRLFQAVFLLRLSALALEDRAIAA